MPSNVVTLAGHARPGGAHLARANERVDHAGAAQSARRDAHRDQRRPDGGADGEPVDGASCQARGVEAQQGRLQPPSSHRHRRRPRRGQTLKPFVRVNALSRMSSNGTQSLRNSSRRYVLAGAIAALTLTSGVNGRPRTSRPGRPAPQPPATQSQPAMPRIIVTAGRSTVLTTDFDVTPHRHDQSGRGRCVGGRAARDPDRRQDGGHDQPDRVGW